MSAIHWSSAAVDHQRQHLPWNQLDMWRCFNTALFNCSGRFRWPFSVAVFRMQRKESSCNDWGHLVALFPLPRGCKAISGALLCIWLWPYKDFGSPLTCSAHDCLPFLESPALQRSLRTVYGTVQVQRHLEESCKTSAPHCHAMFPLRHIAVLC